VLKCKTSPSWIKSKTSNNVESCQYELITLENITGHVICEVNTSHCLVCIKCIFVNSGCYYLVFFSRIFLTSMLFLARGITAGVFQAAYVYTPEVGLLVKDAIYSARRMLYASIYWHFSINCCHHHQGWWLRQQVPLKFWNINTYLPEYYIYLNVRWEFFP